jgi:hypothetical protein
VSWFRLESPDQVEVGVLPTTRSIVEFVFEAAIPIVCGVAWAMAGFPHFMDVAPFLGLGLVCVGAYVWMISTKE